MVLGAAVTPLLFYLLRWLPDRGYAFAKIAGLLLVAFVFWLLASLGFLSNTTGGILLALVAVSSLSVAAFLYYRESDLGDSKEQDSQPLGQWLRANWRYILAVELVFGFAFFFWVWVRAQNPAISATEKPMEFAFLNSAGRSPTYPPLDPWLSGFAISYYYFGYVMTSVIGRLALVAEPIGFNLGIAWLAAASSIGAFGLVYNLVAARKEALRRNAIIFGLVAALAIPVAGNMEVLLEFLHANGLGSDAFWSWLDVRDLDGPAAVAETPRYETSQWWWWRSSRVIHEYHLSGRAEEGLEPIAEFPAFSFVLGDMHPHVLALPFAFFSLAIAFAWFRWPSAPALSLRRLIRPSAAESGEPTMRRADLPFIALTAVVLGGLSFLNTWDVLIHLFVVVAAHLLARWRRSRRWHAGLLGEALKLGLFLAIPAVLLYLPFYLGFRSQAGPPFLLPMTMRPTRLTHFLVIFAMPLLTITILVAALVLKSRNSSTATFWRSSRTALLLAVGLVLSLFLIMLLLGWVIALNEEGATRIAALAEELDLGVVALVPGSPLFERLGWATITVARLLPSFVQARLAYPGLSLLLTLLIAGVIFLLLRLLQQPAERWERLSEGTLPFALLLIGTAALLTLGPEFLYLRDNFGQRLNTIFKFYYQAWILFGAAAIYALDYLLRNFRIAGVVAAAAYGLALVAALLFPWFAIQSRAAEFRGPAGSPERLAITLDGLAQLNRYNSDEYEALRWLRDNVDGVPVILEAVGGQYSGFGRVAASTGLPTLLGWAGHEHQWRGNTPEPGEREPVVERIYGPSTWPETADLLDRYGIDLVYFGSLERSTYDPLAGEKFEQNMEVIFRNNGVTIYRRQPERP
jgi:YYY domain-containing protein